MRAIAGAGVFADAANTSDTVRLAALEATVAHLRARVEVLERPRLTRADRLVLLRLLPVLAGVFGSDPFTSRDVVDDPSAALQLVLGGRTAKQIGRLLRRATGQPLAGFVVECAGIEINKVLLWRVLQVSS